MWVQVPFYVSLFFNQSKVSKTTYGWILTLYWFKTDMTDLVSMQFFINLESSSYLKIGFLLSCDCTFVRIMWWKALKNWRHCSRICFKMTWLAFIPPPRVGLQLHVLRLCLILMGRALAFPAKETLRWIQWSRRLKTPQTLRLTFKGSALGLVLSLPHLP